MNIGEPKPDMGSPKTPEEPKGTPVEYDLKFNQAVIADLPYAGDLIRVKNPHVESQQNPEVWKGFSWNKDKNIYEFTADI